MTWKIIDENQNLVDLIDNVMKSVHERSMREGDDTKLIAEIDYAWDKVKDLAKKGIIAEKYMKEWGKE
tara:strand:- start:216 stop:419 length:204 start_codon:yes stop_codon:yes gene_type:complete